MANAKFTTHSYRLENFSFQELIPVFVDSDPPGSPHSGNILSPSQVRCFMDCQTRWWFKYGLKVPDAPTGNMALGKAVHSALGENFAQKVETRDVTHRRCVGVVS